MPSEGKRAYPINCLQKKEAETTLLPPTSALKPPRLSSICYARNQSPSPLLKPEEKRLCDSLPLAGPQLSPVLTRTSPDPSFWEKEIGNGKHRQGFVEQYSLAWLVLEKTGVS